MRKALKTSAGEPITALQEAKAALSEWLVFLTAPSVRKSPFSTINTVMRILNEADNPSQNHAKTARLAPSSLWLRVKSLKNFNGEI